MSAEPKSAGERKPRSVFKKVKNAFKLRRGSRRGSPSRPQHVSAQFNNHDFFHSVHSDLYFTLSTLRLTPPIMERHLEENFQLRFK
jgi:hypothetical protein